MENNRERKEKSLFGISPSTRPKWQQLLIFSSGVFFSFLFSGICEEYVFNHLKFSYGWYFTFFQSSIYLILLYLRGFRIEHMMNPWKTYLKLAVVLMGSNGLTKGSLAYLNYPSQLIFKSTKVLHVMVMGAFIPGLRRKHLMDEYVAAVLLVVGIMLFTLADANTSPNFSIIGVLMISGALVMDSFVGNFQEAIFTVNPGTRQAEMLFGSTIVGLPLLLPPMILTGELFTAWKACSQHPHVYGFIVLEGLATFIGQISVLYLIAISGAATTALITTARKAMTLLLSYLIFRKPLTDRHGLGLILIGMGITLKMVSTGSSTQPITRTTETQQPTRRNTQPEEAELVMSVEEEEEDGNDEDDEATSKLILTL